VFDSLAALEAAGKKAASKVDEEEEVGEGGERTMLHGGKQLNYILEREGSELS